MNKALFTIVIVLFSTVLANNYFKFFENKDYVFIVEAACDPTIEICFTRDCSNSDDCPPNELEIYKVYELDAKYFKGCADNSCAVFCREKANICTQVKCDQANDDTCIVGIQ